MSTSPISPWPDDPMERLEAKLDSYHAAIHGDPSDPSKPGIDGRLRAVESDVGMAKRGLALLLTGGLPMLWDYLQRKTGIK